MFDLRQDKPARASTRETTDPEELQEAIRGIARAVGSAMRNVSLIP